MIVVEILVFKISVEIPRQMIVIEIPLASSIISIIGKIWVGGNFLRKLLTHILYLQLFLASVLCTCSFIQASYAVWSM